MSIQIGGAVRIRASDGAERIVAADAGVAFSASAFVLRVPHDPTTTPSTYSNSRSCNSGNTGSKNGLSEVFVSADFGVAGAAIVVLPSNGVTSNKAQASSESTATAAARGGAALRLGSKGDVLLGAGVTQSLPSDTLLGGGEEGSGGSLVLAAASSLAIGCRRHEPVVSRQWAAERAPICITTAAYSPTASLKQANESANAAWNASVLVSPDSSRYRAAGGSVWGRSSHRALESRRQPCMRSSGRRQYRSR